MTVDRLAQTRLLLEEMIRTAEAADGRGWAGLASQAPNGAARRYIAAVPPSLLLRLARADLAELDEHVPSPGTDWCSCWDPQTRRRVTPTWYPCAVVERIVNKWIGEETT